MKKLNVNLVVKANDMNTAEAIGERELMGLARLIGMSSGSMVASCHGDTQPLTYGKYNVDATIEIDGNGDVNGFIKAVQREWAQKSEILNSTIFVTEEKHEEVTPPPATVVCANCGQILMKGSENIIDPETSNEHYLCDDCLGLALNRDEVVHCDCCDTWVSDDELVENPVTEENSLCPYCGDNIG